MLGKCTLYWDGTAISTAFRNYVTQDVLRRIMSDYFGYDVHFVMNITDIDDKVSLAPRSQGSRNSAERWADHPPRPPNIPCGHVPLRDAGADSTGLEICARIMVGVRAVQGRQGSSRNRASWQRQREGNVASASCSVPGQGMEAGVPEEGRKI